ncbi:tetrahydrodipicolinate N-succinyltransferase N-terminal domain-containing protein [Sulfurospirillum arcachonense]|uniref:tetrahydrodipicolinate N-succinyltransferase N-terminal domain-containing protein n=1 Tax=Sulfurospirillum arcachonense TaxID=57666 RepID=UPI00046A2962|nr:tetrahydrodipicolinate N-succinyltransferase N-terminal domain-containing protein [Sulfurospirillum arcachonense]
MKNINSVEDFKSLIEQTEAIAGYKKPIGFGIARVDRGQLNPDKILQANFPVINWNENFGSAAVFVAALIESGVEVDFSASEFVCDVKKKFVKNAMSAFVPYLNEATGDAHKNVQVIKTLDWIKKTDSLGNDYRLVFLFEDEAPKSVESVYLKLYALSTGKAPLRSLNLNGAFGVLDNVAWSMGIPIELEWLRVNEIEMKLQGTYPIIESVDKFPRFLSHVIPQDNTRILDASKVRMGAQLSAGTTVMPGASYINFNAGTTGSVMVEGRISSSAIVGKGSDVGGGASILGVLSGTDGNPIAIGENTLLGANSVTGIPLGDGCIVDAGIAILEGTKIGITPAQLLKIQEANPEFEYVQSKDIQYFKGLDLSGLHGIHFRQNSKNGMIMALRSQREVVLNSDLH